MADNDLPTPSNETLIALLQKQGALPDSRFIGAFAAVPRHLFLPGFPPEVVYQDEAIAVKIDDDGRVLSSSSQPSMIAAQLNQLDLSYGDNVLEIGAGTGYAAALMQQLVGENGRVTTLELDQDLVKLARANLQRMALGSKINVVQTDGAMGYAPRAAYDRVIASVGMWDVPDTLVHQLKIDGVIVVPLWLNALQVSAAFSLRRDETLYSPNNLPCAFVHLRGPASGPQLSKRIASSALVLTSNEIDQIDSAMLFTLFIEQGETIYFQNTLSAAEYWNGFLPYLGMREQRDFHLALYDLVGGAGHRGMVGPGFALVGHGTACFVPYEGEGLAHTYGAADAFITLQNMLDDWHEAGRPNARQMRVMLTAHNAPEPDAFIRAGLKRQERRDDHDLFVWFDQSAAAPASDDDEV